MRVSEPDRSSYTIAAARSSAQAVAQTLGEPALRARRGDYDQFGIEWVSWSLGQQFGQAVGKNVDAVAAVNVKGHVRLIVPRADSLVDDPRRAASAWVIFGWRNCCALPVASTCADTIVPI